MLVNAGLPATYGTPAKAPSDEWVRVGGIIGTQEAVVLNSTRRPRDEDYNVDVLVRVRRADQQLATERAYELAGVVEVALRSDPTLGDAVMWAVVTGHELAEGEPDGTSRLADLIVTITCRARVQGA